MLYVWPSLMLLLICMSSATAEHLVSPAELQQALVEQAEEREAHLHKIRDFFQFTPAGEALRKGGVEPEKLNRAIGTLSDEELARLAVQTEQVRSDFAAGALTNQQLTYIVIALATALVVVLLVT